MRGLIAITVSVAALGAVGSMDFEDEAKHNEYKCEMVESGAWPESVLEGVECDE